MLNRVLLVSTRHKQWDMWEVIDLLIVIELTRIKHLDFAYEGRNIREVNNLNNVGSYGNYMFFIERVFGKWWSSLFFFFFFFHIKCKGLVKFLGWEFWHKN